MREPSFVSGVASLLTPEHLDSWRAWLRLGLAYDASADRKRARWATREAIKLSRAPHPTSPE